ncbi:hypothetical protein PR048_000982 [Dryococelus australis]|uniref:Reverse transcriptase/retrotransposon-derived protein RNase H-like domain-containing protein n=1 Tax=Dryococelus australis TaxID=614101 RepID=A0ABQ9IG61_9NEOP|nr:hypothetical protein PR048_000982 [Dryococelus australis]
MEEVIETNVKREVWIPVNHAGPWASAIVTLSKRDGTLGLCADCKGTMNHAISSDTFKSPILQHVLSELAGGCIYGMLNLEEAHIQIPVDGDTSRMLTENTVQGLHSHILGDAGFKVNSDKYVWPAASVEVLGFRLDAEGIHRTTDKTAAITNAPKFMYETSNPDLPLVVTADASSVGVGAVLAHIIPGAQPGRTIYMSISYVSRTLSATEKAYLQIDWEGLAVILAVKKFTPYLAYLLLTGQNHCIYLREC